MFTKTSLSAIRTLTYLGLQQSNGACSTFEIAEYIGESPTYLAKVTRKLVIAGLLQAHLGSAGGIQLRRNPAEITLLSIIEACQGVILGNFCTETTNLRKTCAFHQAGAELHEAIVEVMSRWTLQDFLRKPGPAPALANTVSCWLSPKAKMRAAKRTKRARR
jgi:Rrf2 family protein